MYWTYVFTGKPGAADCERLSQMQEEKPGHLILEERQEEPGICDLWLLLDAQPFIGRAAYAWQCSGTVEDVTQHLASLARP